MNLIISKSSYDDAKKTNDLLTKLIVDEKKYDKNINDKCVVKTLYENFYNNDDICLLIAKKNNKIVGYIYGYIQNNGDAKIDKVAVIDALFVKENARKSGIAQKLINEFKKWAYDLKIKYIELKVCKDNMNAINLYEKMGFVTNKLIMSMELGDNYEDI